VHCHGFFFFLSLLDRAFGAPPDCMLAYQLDWRVVTLGVPEPAASAFTKVQKIVVVGIFPIIVAVAANIL
jgi:hypothetical protein